MFIHFCRRPRWLFRAQRLSNYASWADFCWFSSYFSRDLLWTTLVNDSGTLKSDLLWLMFNDSSSISKLCLFLLKSIGKSILIRFVDHFGTLFGISWIRFSVLLAPWRGSWVIRDAILRANWRASGNWSKKVSKLKPQEVGSWGPRGWSKQVGLQREYDVRGDKVLIHLMTSRGRWILSVCDWTSPLDTIRCVYAGERSTNRWKSKPGSCFSPILALQREEVNRRPRSLGSCKYENNPHLRIITSTDSPAPNTKGLIIPPALRKSITEVQKNHHWQGWGLLSSQR